MTKRQVGTIDLTPTWIGLLPSLLAIHQHGAPEAQSIARQQLERMARAADAYCIPSARLDQ